MTPLHDLHFASLSFASPAASSLPWPRCNCDYGTEPRGGPNYFRMQMECDPQEGAVGFNLLHAVDSVQRIFVEWLVGRPINYRGADKSLARPGRKQADVSVRMAWNSFGALPCRINMTTRVSMLKSRASRTFFRASFLPGRAKDLSAPR